MFILQQQKSLFQLYYNRLGYNIVLHNSLSDVETETESVEGESSNIANNEKNSLVHVSKCSFQVVDFVIIKKDFDNNTNTKKNLSLFMQKCVILELNSNNRASVEFKDGSRKNSFLIINKNNIKFSFHYIFILFLFPFFLFYFYFYL